MKRLTLTIVALLGFAIPISAGYILGQRSECGSATNTLRGLQIGTTCNVSTQRVSVTAPPPDPAGFPYTFPFVLQ